MTGAGADRRIADRAEVISRGVAQRTDLRLGVCELGDPAIRARARHVISENARVEAFTTAISASDLPSAGSLMSESHRSLRDDFECSTPRIDELCQRLSATAGVFGARMTGGGWGGCVVALTAPGAVDVTAYDAAWYVRPSAGARIRVAD